MKEELYTRKQKNDFSIALVFVFIVVLFMLTCSRPAVAIHNAKTENNHEHRNN